MHQEDSTGKNSPESHGNILYFGPQASVPTCLAQASHVFIHPHHRGELPFFCEGARISSQSQPHHPHRKGRISRNVNTKDKTPVEVTKPLARPRHFQSGTGFTTTGPFPTVLASPNTIHVTPAVLTSPSEDVDGKPAPLKSRQNPALSSLPMQERIASWTE